MKLKRLKKIILRSGLFLSTLFASLAVANSVNADDFTYIDQNNQEQTLDISEETTFGQVLGESVANFYVITDGDGEKTLAERTLIPDKNAHILDYIESTLRYNTTDKTFKIIDPSQYEALKDTKKLTFRYQDANYQDHLIELEPNATFNDALISLPIGTNAKLYDLIGGGRGVQTELKTLLPTDSVADYLDQIHHINHQTLINNRTMTRFGQGGALHTIMLLTEEQKRQIDLAAKAKELQQQRNKMIHEGKLFPTMPDPLKSKKIFGKYFPPMKLKPITLHYEEANETVAKRHLATEQENYWRKKLDDLFGTVYLHYLNEHAIVPASVYVFGLRHGQSDQFPDSNDPNLTAQYSNDSAYSCRFYHLNRHDQEELIAILEKIWEIFDHEKEEAYQQYPQLRAKVAEDTKSYGEYQKILQAAIELDLENQKLAKDQKEINYENEVLKIMKNSTNFNHYFASTSDDITYGGTNCEGRLKGTFREIKDSLSEPTQTDTDEQNQLNKLQTAYALLLREAQDKVIRFCCAKADPNAEAEIKTTIENILNPLLFSEEVPFRTDSEDYYASRLGLNNILEQFYLNVFNIEAIQEVINQNFSSRELQLNAINKFNHESKVSLNELKEKLHLNLADEQLRKFGAKLTDDPQEHEQLEQFINGSTKLSLEDLLAFGDPTLRGALFAFLLGHSPISYHYNRRLSDSELAHIPLDENDVIETTTTVDKFKKIQVDNPQQSNGKKWIQVKTGEKIERKSRQLRAGISLFNIGNYYKSIVFYLAMMDSVENPDDAN